MGTDSKIKKGVDFFLEGVLFTITDTIGEHGIMAVEKRALSYEVDDEVLYIPHHAKGNANHPDCEKGTVSSTNVAEGVQKVWVRYGSGITGQLTPTENLVLIKKAGAKEAIKNPNDWEDENKYPDPPKHALVHYAPKERVWDKYYDHPHLNREMPKKSREFMGDTDEIVAYDGGDIWIERLEAPTVTEFPGVKGTFLTEQTHPASGIRTNVQRLEYKHSPTGFNFGYAGSGPADLALNICLMFCNQEMDAYRIYQEFKRTFVCVGQTDRLEIRRGEIENFLLIQGAELNPNI